MVAGTVATSGTSKNIGGEQAPGVKAMSTGFTPPPSMTTTPSGTTGNTTCKWWGTEDGCRKGKACRFAHGPLTDKNSRCWICSAKTHKKSECPYTGGATDYQPRVAAGGSGGREGGNGGREGGKEGGGKGQKGSKGQGTERTKGGDKPQVAAMSQAPEATGEGSMGEGTATGATENSSAATDLITEVTGLLKSMRISGPQVRMVTIRSLKSGEPTEVLLDGGATHCLREAKSRAEWEKGVATQVQLASGSVEMRMNQQTGTILAAQPVQPIIPVSKLTEIGYRLTWSDQGCTFDHGKRGALPIKMVQGCPVVEGKLGSELMDQVEKAESRKVSIRAVLECNVLAESEEEKRAVAVKTQFPQVPDRVIEMMIPATSWEAVSVPLNRRKRRQLDRAERIIIHAFSGKDRERWSRYEQDGTVLLNLDLIDGVDLLQPDTMTWLEQLIRTGKVSMWVSGPPCRAVSYCRYRDPKDGGPPPIRAREGEQRFGLEGLSPELQRMADADAALWLLNLRWMTMVKKMNPEAELLIEQPQDPREWTGRRDVPTYLNWPETERAISELQLSKVTVDQGALGHQRRKPTALLTTIEEVKKLDGKIDVRPQDPWPVSMEEKIGKSRGLARWADGLVEAIGTAIERQMGPSCKKLNSREVQAMEAWRRHCEAGHVPARRDCATCLEGGGRDRARKAQAHSQAFCMSVDLTGPFVPGHDQEIKDCKYMMVATITIPVRQGEPLVQSLKEMSTEKGVIAEDEEVIEKAELVPELGQGESHLLQEGEEETEPGDGGAMSQEQKDSLEDAWRRFVAEGQECEVRTLTLAVPIKDRREESVISGLARIYARARGLGVPILRLHSDRARELTSKEVRAWARARDLMQTFSAGDEPTGNARTERSVGILKARARVALVAADAEERYWPLAMRHAAEELLRAQLRNLGIVAPRLLPFGAKVKVQRKTWFKRGKPWSNPMQTATIWGPASDMSISSNGYYLCTEQGHWIRSTVVVMPTYWGDAVQAVQQEEERAEVLGIMAEDERPVLAIQAHDVPRRRIHQKTAPTQTEADNPSLRCLREGGEWTGTERAEQWEEPDMAQLEVMHLQQHAEMKRIFREEMYRIQDGDSHEAEVRVAKAMIKELRSLEDQMEVLERERAEKVKVEVGNTPEVLQTRVVSPEEVRAHLEDWVPAFQKEVTELTSGPVTRTTRKQVEEWRRQGKEVEVLPMKAIASLKPPARRKGRVVVCGNYAGEKAADVSVGGICTMALRGVVHASALRRWRIGTIDVKCAFLQAPRRRGTKISITEPPNLLKQMNLVAGDEVWQVHQALYGYVESPADWADHRDKKLKELRWTHQEQQYTLQATGEPHMWKIQRQDGEQRGFLCVYVDDMAAAAEEAEMHACLDAIESLWECSPREVVETRGWVRFCGYEMQMKEGGGYRLRQTSYIQDILKRRGITGTENVAGPKIEADEDEPQNPEVLKQAQMVIG